MNSVSDFVETPLGIFTTNGNWYYITSDHIEQLSPGLLNKTPLEEIVNSAEVWVKSSDVLPLLLFLGLIHVVPVWLTVVLSLLFLLFWHFSKSAFATTGLSKPLELLSTDAVVLILAVISLSYMGITERYYEAFFGFLFFFVFRFGWLRKALDAYRIRFNDSVTLNDRVVMMLVLKESVKQGIAVPQIQKMESEMIDLMTRHKKKPGKR